MDRQFSTHLAFARYFDRKELQPFLYLLSRKMAEGNICLDINSLHEEYKKGDDILQQFSYDVSILNGHPLVGSEKELKPFIFSNNKLYLHRFFHYEQDFTRSILQLIGNERTEEPMRWLQEQGTDIVSALFPAIEEANWQMIACITAFLHRFSIITGGPGTGKTSTISKLLVLLLKEHPGTRILLAAPTGKAAARMKESMAQVGQTFQREGIPADPAILHAIEHLDAVTIHTLLGYRPGSIHFRHDEQHPLDADVLIIDECSMIDIALFKKLLQAVDKERTRLILLGDRNQLASVEAGSLFGDLCTSMEVLNTFSKRYAIFFNSLARIRVPIPVDHNNQHPLFQHITELRRSYRFNDEQGIGKFSKAILEYHLPLIRSFYENTDRQVWITEYHEDVLLRFAEKFADKETGYIHEPDTVRALNKINQYRILCALKRGPYGVYEVNRLIERAVLQVQSYGQDSAVYHNQMIMVTGNQPEFGIFNGDTGLIRAFREENKTVYYACFRKNEEEFIKILPGNIREWETAYAITIHKSQGSEFREALILLPDEEEHPILSRELLYTAVTRAREKVWLLGTPPVIERAASQQVDRISGIRERLMAYHEKK